ncbi:MAG TPA: MmgE/PrpD family protein, partial [Rhodopila sp.]|nr:MmgE/PrpD family protein [Rhodopila sp.]
NVGARIGATLFDAELAGRFRPTGVTGPIGAACAGARLLGLDADCITAAIGQAANCVAGLNNWPWAGSTEVFFHAGNGARNAVTAALLAQAGEHVSPSALDGQGGLYDAYQRHGRARGLAEGMEAFQALREIYFKPAPACNFVQTACQAGLALSQAGVTAADVTAIEVATFPAAAQYPGCNFAGPFQRLVQAKMSIQFSVAATLVQGALRESAFTRLDDPELLRLVGVTTMTLDPEFTAAFPAKQGAGVTVTLKDGTLRSRRLPDVRPCEPPEIHARFRAAAEAAFGPAQAETLETFVMRLDTEGDARTLIPLLVAQDA